MDRAERRRMDRALGIPTTKMKRRRPPSSEVLAAIRDRVQERERENLALGRLLIPKKEV